MLFIVLILVLAALGLLITALVTASQTWAWISIGLSLVAALVLVIDWLRRRAREGAGEEAVLPADSETADSETTAVVPVDADGEPTTVLPAEDVTAPAREVAQPDAPADEDVPVKGDLAPLDPGTTAAPEPAAEPAAADPAPAAEAPPETPAEKTTESTVVTGAVAGAWDDEDEDPGEEDTDAADLLIVCDLDDQVIVIDEHPRYHLAGCGWLHDRDPIPIAVAEARELGFTPCVLCGPDSVLAGKHRKRHGARR